MVARKLDRFHGDRDSLGWRACRRQITDDRRKVHSENRLLAQQRVAGDLLVHLGCGAEARAFVEDGAAGLPALEASVELHLQRPPPRLRVAFLLGQEKGGQQTHQARPNACL